MNILPKKRWHVRTKENIARVRKDEAEAAEKEKQETLRTEKADREARLRVLKFKSKQKLLESGIIESEPKTAQAEHINLFSNFEDAVKTANKEHDKELKDKKEEYEKKIGYLTYLGQDTNEALGKKNWYEVLPDKSTSARSSDIKDTYDKLVFKDEEGKPTIKKPDEKDGEINWKKKQLLDPMNAFKHLHYSKDKKAKNYTSKAYNGSSVIDHKSKNNNEKAKHKLNKKLGKDKNDREQKLQKLREARLKREQQERYRTEMFLNGLNNPVKTQPEKEITKVKPKYNSQFNPELARQNFK